MVKELAFKYKWFLLTGIGFLILVDIMNMIPPYIMGEVVDGMRHIEQEQNDVKVLETQKTEDDTLAAAEITPQDPIQQILRVFINRDAPLIDRILPYTLIIAGAAIIIGIFRFWFRFFIFGNARRIEKDIRAKLFKHLQVLTADFFNRNKVGDLMAHATNDLNAVTAGFGAGVMALVDALLGSVVYITILFWLSPELSTYAFIPLPIVIIIIVFGGQAIHRRFQHLQEKFAKITGKITENLSNIRVIKAYVQEDKELENVAQESEEYVSQAIRLARIAAGFGPAIWFTFSVSIAIAMVVGGTMVYHGELSLGTYVKFTGFLGLIVMVFMSFGWTVNIYQRARASYDRIRMILDMEPEIHDPEEPVVKERLNGEIEFRNLTFIYKGTEHPVLHNISMRIPPRKVVAFFGDTGAGKSTLAQLLARIYDGKSGTVLIDGIDVQQYSVKMLRSRIAYVPQETFLFTSTIADNIRFGNPGLADDDVYQAAKLACVYDNIMDFPEQFETLVGERGVTLSGGQKQRTALARAIIKRPDILILDDAFSAIDTETEEQILDNCRDILQDQTTILISHRCSTVANCDYIYVLDKGHLVEEGTHEALLEKKGHYYHTFEKQLAEDEEMLENTSNQIQKEMEEEEDED